MKNFWIKRFLLSVGLALSWLHGGHSQIITTIAGGYVGDGGPATNAPLIWPGSVALDSVGNLYIADTENERIRKVDTNGLITTVAGNGNAGYSGDGGAANNAMLNEPRGLAVDKAGNLYIADSSNYCIRKVSTNGLITTVAGNGSYGYSGDGGPATNAMLDYPDGVTVDGAGIIFISDTDNCRIRKVDTNGIIATVAGNGSYGYSGDGGTATNAMLNDPSGVAVDSTGNLFIADFGNVCIRKVDTNGIITSVAGTGYFGYSGDGGLARYAKLNYPQGVVLDGAGNLYIGDTFNYRIRKIGTNGIITTVAGNGHYGYSGDGGAATSAALSLGDGGNGNILAVDGVGNLYIADSLNNRIRKVSTNHIITTVAGGFTGDGGVATKSTLNSPSFMTVDTTGNLYIVDTDENRVRKVGTNGIITTVAGTGIAGNSGNGSAATNAMLNYPEGVTVDGAGNIFIADTYNSRIRKVATNNIITTVAGNGSYGYSGDGGAATNAMLNYPVGVTVDGAGNIFIADGGGGNSRIRKVANNNIITTVAGNGTNGYSGDGGAATNAMVNYPGEVTVDGAGNIFIPDTYNHRIRKVDANGVITSVAGNGTNGYSGDGGAATNAMLYNPSDVAVDSAGNFYIADFSNQRIRKVDTNGIITTLAGNGTRGFSGDGGAAINAMLAYPVGLSVDSANNLYIADQGNNRIRMVSKLPPPQNFSASPGSSPQQLSISFSGALNYPYLLQSATNLTPPINWQAIITNNTDANGNWIFTDTNLNPGQKFYRAVGQ